jgi:competence protein ComEC
LWDVGFQLSYAAVLGIVLFTKPIYNCLYFQNKILSKIWQGTCVTIAAQILTLPIVLYNFHQFPFTFLITNLLVVLLSEVILFATLILVLISKWTWLSVLIGKVTQFLLWLMNSIIEHTEKLPFALWTNIKTDEVQVGLLYLIIILLAVWLLYKMPRLVIYSLVLAVVFIIYTSTDIWRANHQQKIIVYNISKHTAIDIVARKQAVCFCDSALMSDIQANNLYIKPCRTLLRANHCSNKILSTKDNLLLHTSGKTVLLISHALPRSQISNKIKADLVIVTNNPKLYMNDLCRWTDCHIIVADNNTSQWKMNKWKRECDSLHIRFHSVAKQGAFVMDL